MISERTQRLKYIVSDYVTANAAWLAYDCLRYWRGGVRGYSSIASFLTSDVVLLEQLLFPAMMMAVYYLSGYYNEVFRKSRLSELITTLTSSAINTLTPFFLVLLNDMQANSRTNNYEMVLFLFGLLFSLTYLFRLIITSHTSYRIKKRIWSFETLVVGNGAAAFSFVQKMKKMRSSLGYHVVGYVSIPGENAVKGLAEPVYTLDEVGEVCARDQVKELIVVPTKQDMAVVLGVINRLYQLNLPIKITAENFNIPLSKTRLANLCGDPLIDISGSSMSESGKNIKRLLDLSVSGLLLVTLIPVYALLAAIVKCDSKGSVFYRQERLGLHNRPFQIIKYRSMRTGAESSGMPQLASDDDPRITKVGKVLRKYRLDELPQFWNVLKGDMSIVGPRPERQYFAEQILAREPAYSLVYQVRPGITSMGMVKFGYARNVDEMLERLHYDLLYLENMSIINDLKIIVYTIKIVFTGRGV